MSTGGIPDDDLDARLEQALRARLHEVDDLVPPPAPDFAARAVAAARAQAPSPGDAPEDLPEDAPARLAPVVPLHRRAWAKALVGVAATLVLGTGVVTGLQHLGSGGTSSATSEAAAGGSAGGATPASVPLDGSTGRAGGPGPASAAGAGPRADVLATGTASGPSTTSLPDAVARLQQRLREPSYADRQATVALRGTVVVVTLPASVDGRPTVDPPLVDLVAGSLPAGTPVEYRAR